MDRFEAMSILITVTELGSFSAASRLLHMPVTTLSRKISDLEKHVGSKLLIRSTRKLTLTDTGVTYVAASRRILEMLAEAEKEAAGEFVSARGELVITAPMLFGRMHVLPVVAEFLAQFPDINVRLILSDHSLNLIDNQIDMAVRIGELPDSSLVATRIGVMRSVICAAPALLAQLGTPTSPQDLHRYPTVSAETQSDLQHWRFRSATENYFTIPVSSQLAVTTADAALHAAVLGVGVTRLLHYQVVDAVASGALHIILEEFELPPLPISLIHVSRSYMPVKMRQFINFSSTRLRSTMKAISP